jgi:hypothetical protein
MSSVASCLASTTGGTYGATIVAVPMRIRLVQPATWVSVTIGSTVRANAAGHGWPGVGG